MRIFGALFLLMMMISLTRVPPVQAVEEGQLMKKDGKWEYYAGEDPGLKYLYLKGIINEEEYNKGLKVLETKERIAKPNFNIDVNNGLNIRVGEIFKVRLLIPARVLLAPAPATSTRACSRRWGCRRSATSTPNSSRSWTRPSGCCATSSGPRTG